MTYMITCSRCKTEFDLDEADAGSIFVIPLNRIPLCANCIDDIVYEYLVKEEE